MMDVMDLEEMQLKVMMDVMDLEEMQLKKRRKKKRRKVSWNREEYCQGKGKSPVHAS